MVAEDRRLGDERRDRRPQLVADVGDEPPVLGLGGLEAEDRLLERVDHLVELLGPRAELVVGGHRDAGRQVAARDPLGGPGGLVDRGQDAAGDEPGGDHADDHDGDRAGDQREPQLAERLVDRALVADEPDRRARSRTTRPPTTRLGRPPTFCHE